VSSDGLHTRTQALVSAVTGARRPRATMTLLLALAAVGLTAAVVNGDVEPDAPAAHLRDAPLVPSEEAEAPDAAPDDLPADTVLVWAGARLPDGYAQAIEDDERVPLSTLVRGEILELVATRTSQGEVVDELPDGWWYPVEVLAFEPDSYDRLLGRELLADLDADEAVLSETSAQIRGLDAGDVLEFEDGTQLTVADVQPDALLGAAEVAVRSDGPLEVPTEKYLLARTPHPDGHDALAQYGTEDREPRLVPHGTTPVLRHAHGTLPQVQRKLHFGEFAMQDRSGRAIRPGQSWVDEHVVVESVPILGRIQCHRELIEPVRAAMQELVDRGAEHVIDDYAGCWVPRTSGTTGPLSSHAWGMSIDFNARANPYGAEPNQPDILVEVMADHGFLWGGDWDVPDAMHFELAPGRDTSRE
jgi:hypothetical protein